MLSHLIVEEEDEDVAMGERERDGEDDGNAVGQRKSQRKRRRPSKLDNAMNEDAKAPKKKKGGSTSLQAYQCKKCNEDIKKESCSNSMWRNKTRRTPTCLNCQPDRSKNPSTALQAYHNSIEKQREKERDEDEDFDLETEREKERASAREVIDSIDGSEILANVMLQEHNKMGGLRLFLPHFFKKLGYDIDEVLRLITTKDRKIFFLKGIAARIQFCRNKKTLLF